MIEWHILKPITVVIPALAFARTGCGRDPEPSLVGSFLDSGLRRNDEKHGFRVELYAFFIFPCYVFRDSFQQ